MTDPERQNERKWTKQQQLLASYRLAFMSMNLAELLETGGKLLDSVDTYAIEDTELLACVPLDGMIRRSSLRDLAQLNLNFNDNLPDKDSREPVTSFSLEFIFCNDPSDKNSPRDVVALHRSAETPSSFTVTLVQEFGDPMELATVDETYVGSVVAALVSPGATVNPRLYARPELKAAKEIIESALKQRADEMAVRMKKPPGSVATGGTTIRTYVSPSSLIPGSIEVTRFDGDPVAIELRRSIQNDFMIVGGKPREVITDIVTVIDLRRGNMGVSHFISHGPDSASEYFEPNRNDITMIREFIHHAAPRGSNDLLLGEVSDEDVEFLLGNPSYPGPESSEQDGFDAPDAGA